MYTMPTAMPLRSNVNSNSHSVDCMKKVVIVVSNTHVHATGTAARSINTLNSP